MRPIFCVVRARVNIARCLAVRRTVFIEGHGVPEELEVDGKDDTCIHFLGGLDNAVIATLRIQILGPQIKIQRVAVLEEYRSTGAGRGIMEAALAWARNGNYQEVTLGAQVSVIGFYEKLGFISYGERYMEAGIKHQNMQMRL